MENLGPLCAVMLFAIIIGLVIWWQAKRPAPEPYTLFIKDDKGNVIREVSVDGYPCARFTTVPTFQDSHKAQ